MSQRLTLIELQLTLNQNNWDAPCTCPIWIKNTYYAVVQKTWPKQTSILVGQPYQHEATYALFVSLLVDDFVDPTCHMMVAQEAPPARAASATRQWTWPHWPTAQSLSSCVLPIRGSSLAVTISTGHPPTAMVSCKPWWSLPWQVIHWFDTSQYLFAMMPVAHVKPGDAQSWPIQKKTAGHGCWWILLLSCLSAEIMFRFDSNSYWLIDCIPRWIESLEILNTTGCRMKSSGLDW